MKTGTWEILAVLRFFLASVVVSFHLMWVAPDHVMTGLAPLGPFAAVVGFLFVSGYSIAHSYDRRPVGFYRRRLLRIYPAYAASVAFSLIPFAVGHRSWIGLMTTGFGVPQVHTVLLNLAFLQNWVAAPLTSDVVVWTLSVECACYFATPVLARMGTGWLLVAGAASLVAFLLRPVLHVQDYFQERYGLPTLFLAWSWLAGFLFYRNRQNVVWAAAMSCLFGVAFTVNGWPGSRLQMLTVMLSVFVVVVAATARIPKAFSRPMELLGDLSYPLYLFHVPSILLCWVVGWRSPWAMVSLSIAVSLAALALDTILKRRLVPARPALKSEATGHLAGAAATA